MKNTIRHHRYLNGEMTQQELASRAGVARQTIIAIEKGSFNPSVKLALKLARILNSDVHTLFSLEDND